MEGKIPGGLFSWWIAVLAGIPLVFPVECPGQSGTEPARTFVPIVARGHMENGVNGPGNRADGKTALMMAVENSDVEVVVYLLERGADLSMRDKSGLTALDIAIKAKAKDMERLLRLHRVLHPPASEYYANKCPEISIAGGQNQTGSPGCIVRRPLSVSVADKQGKPMPNAPVRFEVNPGDGQLMTSSRSAASSSIVLRTDQNGICSVYFALPTKPVFQSRIKATAGQEGNLQNVIFAATTNDGKSGPSASPFAPTYIAATLNSDGSADISWTNHTDPEDQSPIPVQYKNINGNWVTVATVPAGTTSYHIPPQ